MRTVVVVITLFSFLVCVRLCLVLYRDRTHGFIWYAAVGILTVWNLMNLAAAIDAWMAR